MRRNRSFYQAFTDIHTHDPCIMASHALLLCKVVRKWARFASAAASALASIAVLITPEPLTADSSGAWSSSGGVASRGDGVGDGDNDSEGVELVECYSPGNVPKHKRKGTRVSSSDG
jgi:hypothetical protein